MADTRVQLEVEDWVRREWMPSAFHQRFRRERVPLTSGGVFDFDAVSDDDAIVGTISTSGSSTAGGKLAVGKLLKIRSDMLFLLLAKASRRIVVLTEQDMHELCMKERDGGRVPPEIEFVLAEIPELLRVKLAKARKSASDEVKPRGRR
jgi:hypothetical protein